ncbi:DUF7507 domain-containing protein, partial [Halocynthiibacter sp.]|uniref:DUF7507 domain-containing protein n=1 Tax=Halocynthiibacter sp. TaxID=1979210 RepID=UPI003C4E8D8C
CAADDAMVCDTVSETVTVISVEAEVDTASVSFVDATAGTTGVTNLFDNDKISGAPAGPGNATVVVNASSSLPAELTLNADGSVDVAAGTAPGVYSFDYDLCSTVNPLICETAKATITVGQQVVATAETFPTVAATGGVTTSVLGSDTLNGAAATLSNVNITAGAVTDAAGDPATGVTLDAVTGLITVAENTAAGTYSVAYTICAADDAMVCDTVSETVTVISVEATNDVNNILGFNEGKAGQGNLFNLFGNDKVNGEQASVANATVAVNANSAVPAGLTLNPDGSVDVAAATQPGVYSFDYDLCSTVNPLICSTAKATVTVGHEITAAPEVFDLIGQDGGVTSSVLTSDVLNAAPADLTTVDITEPEAGDYTDDAGNPATGLTLDPMTGLITVAPNTPAGVYSVAYEICTIDLPVNCASAVETVTVAHPKLVLTLQAMDPKRPDGSPAVMPNVGDFVPYVMTVTNKSIVPVENIAISGVDLTNIVCNPTTLAPNEMATCTMDPYEITVKDINAGGIEKTAQVTGTSSIGTPVDDSDTRNNGGSETRVDPDMDGVDDDMDPTNDPTFLALSPPFAEPGVISVVKTVDRAVVAYGDTVLYKLVFTNTSVLNVAGLDLVDELPGGIAYTPGTAMVGGVVTEPTVSGRQLSWSGMDIAAGASVEVTLQARVVPDSATQDLVNSAWATQDGTVVSDIGTATVRVRVEHVFDCSDVIGKVFDDRNGNGIQNEGEEGLAAVRLVTVNGHLITTDQHGRFHVPCAALPEDGGSNFTLKLDTRTLPSGYRMTTENPRVLRLTAGRFGRINFGATLSEVAQIDLDATAFQTNPETGEREAIEALSQALINLLNDPATPIDVVRLRYHRGSETSRAARLHLDLVEEILEEAWTGQRGTRLLVERETLQIAQ